MLPVTTLTQHQISQAPLPVAMLILRQTSQMSLLEPTLIQHQLPEDTLTRHQKVQMPQLMSEQSPPQQAPSMELKAQLTVVRLGSAVSLSSAQLSLGRNLM